MRSGKGSLVLSLLVTRGRPMKKLYVMISSLVIELQKISTGITQDRFDAFCAKFLERIQRYQDNGDKTIAGDPISKDFALNQLRMTRPAEGALSREAQAMIKAKENEFAPARAPQAQNLRVNRVPGQGRRRPRQGTGVPSPHPAHGPPGSGSNQAGGGVPLVGRNRRSPPAPAGPAHDQAGQSGNDTPVNAHR